MSEASPSKAPVHFALLRTPLLVHLAPAAVFESASHHLMPSNRAQVRYHQHCSVLCAQFAWILFGGSLILSLLVALFRFLLFTEHLLHQSKQTHMNQRLRRVNQRPKERCFTCRIAAINFFRSAMTRCCLSNAIFEAATAWTHCSCVRWLASSARMASSSMASGVHSYAQRSLVKRPATHPHSVASTPHAPALGARHPALQTAGACAACAGSSGGSCLTSHLKL